MILFGIISIALIISTLLIRKSIRDTLIVYIGSIVTFYLFVYKIPLNVWKSYFDFEIAIKVLIVLIIVVIIHQIFKHYLKTDVYKHLKKIGYFFYPDYFLKSLVLFFIGQLLFFDLIVIKLIIMIFIGNILRIEKKTIYLITLISLSINYVLFESRSILQTDILMEVNTEIISKAEILYLLGIIIIAFIIILYSTFNAPEMKKEKIIDTINKNKYQLLSILLGYIIIFISLIQVFNMIQTYFLCNIIILMFLSYLSKNKMKYYIEEKEKINFSTPYILTILIIIINLIIFFIFREFKIVQVTLIILFNIIVLYKYKKRVSYNDFKNDQELYLVLFIAAIFLIFHKIGFEYSYINNYNLNTTIAEEINNLFATNIMLIQIIIISVVASLFYFGQNLTMIFMTNTYNLFIAINLITILVFFNVFTVYIFQKLLNLTNEEVLDNLAKIGIFLLLNLILLVNIIIFI